MALQIKKAIKNELRARIAITGPSGSGKTYTALKMALALGQRVAVIDTESASASRYADEFDFDVVELDRFSPANYIEAIRLVEAAGYDVLIIDSLSHAWFGSGGVLDIAGSKFSGWKDATPAHNDLVNAILNCKIHVIATMRAKMDHVQEQDTKSGKTVVRKLGMAPVQRDGVEYEFDIVFDLDWSHVATVSKTRCRLLDGRTFREPGEDVAAIIKSWLAFDPTSARRAIVALPGATDEDRIRAEGLTDRASLGALYKEVSSRGKQ